MWAWKQASVLCRSAREWPPTHFATVAPREGMTDAEFGKASGKFFAALVRLMPGLKWFRVREWSGGRVHDHALIRADRVSRRAVRRSKLLAGVRASVRPVRSVFAACRYLVKHGRWSSKAEVVPKDFSDKLFTSSRKFLVRAFADLWKELRGERSGKRGVA